MATRTKIKIVFPQGGIIPKSVLKLDEDKHCLPGEAVSVPFKYGDQLIRDKFAVEATKEHKGAGARKVNAAALKKLETAVEAAKKASAEAQSDEDKKAAAADLAEAEQALADAQS